jgi:hypothetical protein
MHGNNKQQARENINARLLPKLPPKMHLSNIIQLATPVI